METPRRLRPYRTLNPQIANNGKIEQFEARRTAWGKAHSSLQTHKRQLLGNNPSPSYFFLSPDFDCFLLLERHLRSLIKLGTIAAIETITPIISIIYESELPSIIIVGVTPTVNDGGLQTSHGLYPKAKASG